MKKYLKQFMGTALLIAAFVLTATAVKAAPITNESPMAANGEQKIFALEEHQSVYYKIRRN